MKSKVAFKIVFVSVATTLMLLWGGCSSGGGDSSSTTATTTSSGASTKGPFQKGSTVIAYKLNSDGTRSSTSVTTTTYDDAGHFDFGSSISWSGPTEFIIYGNYLNENSGQYMELPAEKGLSAVVNVVAGTNKKVNINILTHTAAKAIKAKMAQGVSINTAQIEAEKSVEKTFNLKLDNGVSLTDLDITDSTKNSAANAQLLILSSAVLKTSDPEGVIEKLANDLSDGSVDNEALAALDEVKQEAATVNLEEVATTLADADIGVQNPPAAIDVLKGTLSLDHNMSFTPVNGAFKDTNYTSNEVVVNGIIGEQGEIAIEGGEYSIDGGAFTSVSGIVANGQKVRVKITSSAEYSTSTVANLSIGGGVIPFKVTTMDDPFIPDTSPDDFSFGYLKDQAKNTVVTSSSITVSGINNPTPISITGGEYSIDGGVFTSASGIVANGQKVEVRHTTASTGGTATTTTLTIGDKSAKFISFTVADDKIIDPVAFTEVKDVNFSATPVVTSNTITISGINVDVPISIVDGNYSINGGSYTNSDANVSKDDNITVQTLAPTEYATSKTVTLKIGSVIVPFTVTTMPDPFVADTTPDSFSFTTMLNLPTATDVDQNISVSGINTPTPISVENGLYSINGAAFTDQDGNVSSGDTVTLRVTTADSYETEKVATLTIGGVSASFKTKTMVEDLIPDDFSFDSNLSVALGTAEVVSNSVTISGLTPSSSVSLHIEGGEYSLDGGSTWSSDDTTVSNGDTIVLKQVPASTPGTTKITTLTVGTLIRSFVTKTVDNPPQLTGTPPTTAVEDSEYSFKPIKGNDSGEITLWSITNKPSWAIFNNITGELSGTPKNEDVGSYTDINITATNDQGSDSIVFDINVTNTNDAPVAQDINLTTNEDTAISFDVNVTDVDVGDSWTLSYTQPAHGTVSDNNGTLTYTPASNYFGTDSFTYTATDIAGATDTATVLIVINPVADPAVIGGDLNATILADTTDVAGVLTIDDPDPNENGVNELNATGAYGWLTLLENGSWTYLLNNNDTVKALAKGETVYDTFSISSLDGNTTVALNISIVGVNDAPQITDPLANVTVKKLTDLNLSLVTTASDIDHNATLRLVSANSTGATVTIDDSASGLVTFNASTAGDYTLDYVISDEYNATVNGSVHITVTNSDAPVALPDSVTLDEDSNVTIDVLANDSDDFTADENLTITITQTQEPLHGSVTVNADNTITYIPEPNYNGVDGFSYTITDEDGGFDSADVNITINPVNDAPLVTNKTFSTQLDTSLTLTENDLMEGNSDVDGDDIFISQCDTNTTQGVSIDYNGTITYTPPTDFIGTDSFTCLVSDGNLTTPENITIIVSGNHAPVIESMPQTLTLTLGESVSGVIYATDVDANDTLTFALDLNNSDLNNLQGSVLNSDGSYTLVASHVGSGTLSIVVTDDGNPQLSDSVVLTVNIIYPDTQSVYNSLSDGATIDQATFDSLSGLSVITDTKLYAGHGVDYNSDTNTTTLETGWLEFVSDGTFLISDENISATWSSDSNNLITVAFDNTPIVEAKLISAGMDEADLVNELPFLTALHMPDNAVVYKIALHMLQDEYDVWGPVNIWINGVEQTYATLADMIDNNASGIISYNEINRYRLLAFAPNSSLSDGSGIVVELDMSDVYEGNAVEPAIINPNAGTWSVGTYTENDNNATMIVVTLNDGVNGYPTHPILIDSGITLEDGTTSNVVYRGSFEPSGYMYEYRFNEVAMAVIMNAFDPVTPTEFSQSVENNTTELNATEFDSLQGISGVDIASISPIYSVDTWTEYNGTVVIESEAFAFDGNGGLSVTAYRNNILDSTETLSYSVNGDTINITQNNISVVDAKILGDVNSTELTSLTGGVLFPSDATAYFTAGMDRITTGFSTDQNLTVFDANGTIHTFASLSDLITNAQLQNDMAFEFRGTPEGGNYALAFEDNSTGSVVGDSGNLVQIDLDTNQTSFGGTWEIVSAVIDDAPDTAILVIQPANSDLFGSYLAYMESSANVVVRVDLDQLNGAGGTGYMFAQSAYDIINANFVNQMLLPFTYAELSNTVWYSVVYQNSNIVTITFESFYDHSFYSSATSQMYHYSLIDGNIMVSDGSTMSRVENYGSNFVISFDPDGEGGEDPITMYVFKTYEDASRFISMQGWDGSTQ